MTHRSYEPKWWAEATAELNSLLSSFNSGDDAKSIDHDCQYYTADGVCQYCALGADDEATS